MNWDSLIGVLGTLSGLVLGSILSTRSQRLQQVALEKSAQRQRRESAFADLLACYRQFRKMVMTTPVCITVTDKPDGTKVPLVADAAEYWERVESARARMEILVDDPDVAEARSALARRFNEYLRARAEHPVGTAPTTVLDALRQAEDQFIAAARRNLEKH